MTISLIDPSKTTYTTRKGIGGYENPAVNVVQLVDGRFYNDDKKDFVKSTTDMLNIKFRKTDKFYATSFTALFCAFHGLKKEKSDRTLLINPAVGWHPYNAVHINRYIIRMIKNNQFVPMQIETKTAGEFESVILRLSTMGYTNETDQVENYIYTSDKGFISIDPFKGDFKVYNVTWQELCAIFYFYKDFNKHEDSAVIKNDENILTKTVKDTIAKNNCVDKAFTIDGIPLVLDDIGITEIKTKSVYITEDGSRFPDEKVAKWHQLNVDKGKEAASIVVAHKGGWACAEEIYRLSVTYPGRPPYDDFKAVLANENGIQFIEGDSKYEFEDRPYLGNYRDKILNRQFDRTEAIKIAKALVAINTNKYELSNILDK